MNAIEARRKTAAAQSQHRKDHLQPVLYQIGLRAGAGWTYADFHACWPEAEHGSIINALSDRGYGITHSGTPGQDYIMHVSWHEKAPVRWSNNEVGRVLAVATFCGFLLGLVV